MPTRKIGDLPQDKVCRHPEHKPASHIVLQPGVYEHECPACGAKQVFTVRPQGVLGTAPAKGAGGVFKGGTDDG